MDEACPIELEHCDCCTPRRGQANDLREIFTPRKMIAPTVLTRMKQRHRYTGYGINRYYFNRFMGIASLACQGEIVSNGRTVCVAWNNMLDSKRLRRVFGRTTTVFTVSGCTLRNESPQCAWNIPLSHDLGNVCRVAASRRLRSYRGVVPGLPAPPCGQHARLPDDL